MILPPTVVFVDINTIKKTFDFNLDFYQAFRQHGYTNKHGNKEKLSIKLLFLSHLNL